MKVIGKYRWKPSISDRVFDICNVMLMMAIIGVMLYPIWQNIVLSFSTRLEAITGGYRLYPKQITLEAYEKVFGANLIVRAYLNTILRTVVGTVSSTILIFGAAYALSKKKLPLRNTITFFLIFTMFFNGGLIPTYLLIRSLGLLDQRIVLILSSLYNAWYILLTRNYIMSIPDSIEESAYIDGASPIRIMFQIMVPLSLPIVATIALWLAVFHWNAWFDALIYIQDMNKQVLQMLLRKILILEQLKQVVPGMALAILDSSINVTPRTVKAAMVIVTIGPIVIVYPFAQKYFMKGIMIGALKG